MASIAAILASTSLSAHAEDAPPVVGGTETVGYTTIDANTGAYGQPGWV